VGLEEMSPTDKQLAELLAEISKKLKDIVASIDRYLEAVKPVEIKIKELKKLINTSLFDLKVTWVLKTSVRLLLLSEMS